MSSSEKTIQILKKLAQAPYEFGVTELADDLKMGKSGTHKLITVLVQQGMAAQKKNKKYCLGLNTYFLGRIYEEHIGIGRYVKPYLVKLRDATGENASFGMWIDGDATLLYKEESLQLIRVVGSIGGRRPFHASAIGKTLAAFSDPEMIKAKLIEKPLESFTPRTIISPTKLLEEFQKIREQGYAISDEELALNAIGIGVPVRDSHGQVWATISVGAPKMRMNQENLDRVVFLTLQIAEEISRSLNSNMVL